MTDLLVQSSNDDEDEFVHSLALADEFEEDYLIDLILPSLLAFLATLSLYIKRRMEQRQVL